VRASAGSNPEGIPGRWGGAVHGRGSENVPSGRVANMPTLERGDRTMPVSREAKFSKIGTRIGTRNRGKSIGGFQSRRDCDPKPRVARNELPWVGSDTSTNPNGVAPTRRNPVGVVNSRKPIPRVGPRCGPTLGFGTESRWDSREVQRYGSWEGTFSKIGTRIGTMNRGKIHHRDTEAQS
jgi:hypothetical protein